MKLLDMYDYKATRDKVYEVVDDYKILKLRLESRTPCFTNDLKLAFVDISGISDPTASYGDWELEMKDRCEAAVARIMRAFNKLYDEDRQLIRRLLLDTQRTKANEQIMYEFGYGRDVFFIAKKEAIVRFGIALNVAVEKTAENKAENKEVK